MCSMGSGPESKRKYTKAVRAREAGLPEEIIEALKSPSDRKLVAAERCGALTQKGTPCLQRKGASTDHPGYGTCAKHGGNTESGVKSAMREMGRDLAHRYKSDTRFGGNRNDPTIATLSPEQALLEEVRRSAAFVRFLEERIGRWNLTPAQDEVIERFANAPQKRSRKDPALNAAIDRLFDDLDQDPEAADLPALTQVHPKSGFSSFTDAREWLFLYREERAHLARVSKMCIDAGVAQRLVTIAEDQGRILASAIRAVLTALNLSTEQAALVPQVVPPILRAVAANQPIPELAITGEVVA